MAISPRYSREIPHRFRLEAQKFDDGTITLANRYISAESNTTKSEKITLAGTGKVVTYTIIHIAADAYAKQTPYAVAIVETDEGARITTQIVDCNFEDLKIGSKVKFVFRKVMEEGASGIINYGYKAILV
jgi:uncharacterized OB-fold protein